MDMTRRPRCPDPARAREDGSTAGCLLTTERGRRMAGTRVWLGVALVSGVMAVSGQGQAATVPASQRELLVVSEMTTYAPEGYGWLYSFLEANSVSMAQGTLDGSYQNIYVLAGESATLDGFSGSLVAMATNPDVGAVDAFLHMHGAPETLWFREGARGTWEVGDALASRPDAAAKLRLLYSTACYGASHTADFLRGGFLVASGALKVNTNAAHDYPTVMEMWRDGWSFGDAQASGNDGFWRWIYDNGAWMQGFGDTDSTKIVDGDSYVTIDGNPKLP